MNNRLSEVDSAAMATQKKHSMMKKKQRIPPPVGSKYRHVFQGEPYEMEVVETPDGIGYKVLGEVFRSPTAAAKSIVGKDQHTNGWNFWNMDSRKNNS